MRTLAVLNGRWTVAILRHLQHGSSRPADLLAAVNAEQAAKPARSRGLSPKVMHEALTRLAGLDLVVREVVPGFPPETHYRPTEAGLRALNDISRIGARGRSSPPTADDPEPPRGVDTMVASPARIWNRFLGGKDNFAVDRAAADAAAAELPSLPVIARQVRLFQADAVRRLSGLGVRQFLDIGTGLPVAGSTHEIAQSLAPESRVVYVDNDPLVLTHARALLTSSPNGACAYIDADLRDPGAILAAAAETLDLSRPVAIMLIAVLHFISDQDDPWGIVERLVGGISGEVYLVISHGASDLGPTALRMQRTYNSRSPVPISMRPRSDVDRFFAGLEMLDPGLVTLARWWPGRPFGSDADLAGHVGIGRRPALLRWPQADPPKTA